MLQDLHNLQPGLVSVLRLPRAVHAAQPLRELDLLDQREDPSIGVLLAVGDLAGEAVLQTRHRDEVPASVTTVSQGGLLLAVIVFAPLDGLLILLKALEGFAVGLRLIVDGWHARVGAGSPPVLLSSMILNSNIFSLFILEMARAGMSHRGRKQ